MPSFHRSVRLAAILMCKGAGAKKVGCLGWISLRCWENTGVNKILDAESVDLVIAKPRDESLFWFLTARKGVALKESRIMRVFYDYDVFSDMNVKEGG